MKVSISLRSILYVIGIWLDQAAAAASSVVI